MKKIKIYRVFGWILFLYGIVGYIALLLKRVAENGIVFSYPAVFGTLIEFVCNVFLWAGLILLWRADKNESPDKKSKWIVFIKVYIIFSLIVILTALMIPILIRATRN